FDFQSALDVDGLSAGLRDVPCLQHYRACVHHRVISFNCWLMKVEQFRCTTCRSASCRNNSAPGESTNSSFSRSSVTSCDSANARSLCCRNSSTHGPTSQPSTLSRMLLSEFVLIEILSTARPSQRRD